MASLSWVALSERLGLSLDELNSLRTDVHAPKGRGLKNWGDYLEKFDAHRPDKLPGDNPYDVIVQNTKFNYSLALVREKVVEQMIVNEKRQVELDQQRGKLITAAQYDAGMLAQQEALLMCLGKLKDIAAADFPPGEQPKIKKRATKWINRIRKAVDEVLRK